MGKKLRDGRAAEPGQERVRSGKSGTAKQAGPAGCIARASGKVGPQIVRSGGKRWTDEAGEIFLDRLAASNNATWAAKECGFSTEGIYARARRDPGFAGRMAAARALAQGRIDEGLNRAAEDFLAGKAPAADAPIVVTSVEEVIAIQKLNRPAQTGEGRRPAWPARPRTLAEVHGSILRKLSAIARKRGLI